jgi:hypothetical protein
LVVKVLDMVFMPFLRTKTRYEVPFLFESFCIVDIANLQLSARKMHEIWKFEIK